MPMKNRGFREVTLATVEFRNVIRGWPGASATVLKQKLKDGEVAAKKITDRRELDEARSTLNTMRDYLLRGAGK